MSEMTREEALAHFGVKGMRWGVRKDQTTVSTPTSPPSSSSGTSPLVVIDYTKGVGSQPKDPLETRDLLMNVGAAVLITGGAVFTAKLLKSSGALKPASNAFRAGLMIGRQNFDKGFVGALNSVRIKDLVK